MKLSNTSPTTQTTVSPKPAVEQPSLEHVNPIVPNFNNHRRSSRLKNPYFIMIAFVLVLVILATITFMLRVPSSS